MSILKLKEAGDEATLTITACAVIEGPYGGQVQFDAGDDRLYLPKSSADRQLERIGLDYDHVVGETLTFSRTPSSKPGSAPFWNVNTAKPNGKPPVAKSNEKKPPSYANKPEKELPEFLRDQEKEDAAELHSKIAGVSADRLAKDLSLYLSITEWVIENIWPLYANGLGWSPESATAAVATIFIQAKRSQ